MQTSVSCTKETHRRAVKLEGEEHCLRISFSPSDSRPKDKGFKTFRGLHFSLIQKIVAFFPLFLATTWLETERAILAVRVCLWGKLWRDTCACVCFIQLRASLAVIDFK